MGQKPSQHEVMVEVRGRVFVGHYTLARRGRWDRLTVWYRGRRADDPEIAHEADPDSTEAVAQELLTRLVDDGSE